MKRWYGTTSCPPGVEARRSDGSSASQVYAAVRATSQKRAAAALRVTLGELRGYFHCESDDDEHYPIPLLAELPPERVVVRPLDRSGTVNGHTEWIAVE